MTKEDKDKAPEVLTIRKKDDLEDLDDELDEQSKRKDEKDEKRKKDKDEKEEKDADSEMPPPPPPPPPPPGGYPPQGGYGSLPPPKHSSSMTSSRDLHKFLSIGLLIGIIILFAGAILSGLGSFDWDDSFINSTLWAVGKIVGGVGLFLTALFVIIPLMTVNDLTDYQRGFIIILMAAIIIGFGLII